VCKALAAEQVGCVCVKSLRCSAGRLCLQCRCRVCVHTREKPSLLSRSAVSPMQLLRVCEKPSLLSSSAVSPMQLPRVCEKPSLLSRSAVSPMQLPCAVLTALCTHCILHPQHTALTALCFTPSALVSANITNKRMGCGFVSSMPHRQCCARSDSKHMLS
jgi:hypothetical protein